MRLVALALAAVLLSGCGRLPDGERVAADVATRLDAAFGPGALRVVALVRRGTARDVGAPDGETRRIVYFDADLGVETARAFGDWDEPGAGTLVAALGAGPRGVTGVRPRGNAAGDRLRVHGSIVYARPAADWVAVAPVGFVAPAGLPSSAGPPRSRGERLTRELETVLRGVSAGVSEPQRQVVEEELARSLAAIEARLAHVEHGYAVAAGPEAGEYLRLARALAAAAPAATRLVPVVTAGGKENLELLRDGRVALALTQGDAAVSAQVESVRRVQAVGALFPEPLHVVVRADGPVHRIGDLVARRVAIGAPGAASRRTVLATLAAHGIAPAQLGAAVELPFADALAALAARRLDAVLQMIGAPADVVRTGAASVPIRLVPLEAAAVERLARESPA